MVMRPQHDENADYVEERPADFSLYDRELANQIRKDMRERLTALMEQLNTVKRDHGMNVDFILQKGPDGLFLPDQPQIRITKDM